MKTARFANALIVSRDDISPGEILRKSSISFGPVMVSSSDIRKFEFRMDSNALGAHSTDGQCASHHSGGIFGRDNGALIGTFFDLQYPENSMP